MTHRHPDELFDDPWPPPWAPFGDPYSFSPEPFPTDLNAADGPGISAFDDVGPAHGTVPAEPDRILLSKPVYRAILRELGARAPEAAGLLIGPEDHEAVTH